MSEDGKPAAIRPAPVTVEDLFLVETKLRVAARDYSSNEHSVQSIECRRRLTRELHAAAREFTRIADAFEAAMARRQR